MVLAAGQAWRLGRSHAGQVYHRTVAGACPRWVSARVGPDPRLPEAKPNVMQPIIELCYEFASLGSRGSQMRAILVLALLACLSSMPFSPSYAANEAKQGETCDGIAVIKCDKGLWCEHPAGQCQVIDGAGTCVKNTEVCDEPVRRLRRQRVPSRLRAEEGQAAIGLCHRPARSRRRCA